MAPRPLINEGRLCIGEQCTPGVLVLGSLPGDLREQLDAELIARVCDAGTHQVRHFNQPVRAWRMLPQPLTTEAAASSSA